MVVLLSGCNGGQNSSHVLAVNQRTASNFKTCFDKITGRKIRRPASVGSFSLHNCHGSRFIAQLRCTLSSSARTTSDRVGLRPWRATSCVCVTNNSTGRSLVFVGIAGYVVAVAGIHPHELTYFNILGGGPRGGRIFWRILTLTGAKASSHSLVCNRNNQNSRT